MPVYSVQYTTLMRAATMLTMGLTLTLGWKRFTRDEDIREIETANAFRNQLRERRNQKHHLFEFKTEE